jgi:hypothetical protein
MGGKHGRGGGGGGSPSPSVNCEILEVRRKTYPVPHTRGTCEGEGRRDGIALLAYDNTEF